MPRFLNPLKAALVLLFICWAITGKTQGCDSTNSPAFKIRLAPLNPASNGTCGVLIYIDSAVSSIPGGPVSYSVFGPNQPTIIINPIPSVTLALSSGVYTAVAMQYPNMCTTSKTIQITIPQAPTISVSPSLTPICTAQANFLIASGASSYTWHTGATSSSIITNPASIIIYSVTGANSNGCATQLQGSFTAQPSPIVIPVPNQFTVCINQSITFTAIGASTYTWNNAIVGTQFSTPVFSTPGNSNYSLTVMGTNTAGCTSTVYYNQSFYVDQCDVGINKPDRESDKLIPTLFPNPAQDYLEIKDLNLSEISSFQISNYLGQTISISSIEQQANTIRISTKELENGLYRMIISTQQTSYSSSFIKH